MYTNATLVARPTKPAGKNQTQVGRPLAPVGPVFIMKYGRDAQSDDGEKGRRPSSRG